MVLSAIPRSSSFFRSCADLLVVLDHAGAVDIDLRAPLVDSLLHVLLGTWVQMCIRVGLNQTKNGLSSLTLLVDERFGRLQELAVHGFHTLAGQRTGVFTALLAHPAELGIFRRGRR